MKEIITNRGEHVTTHRVEAVDPGHSLFIAEGPEVTKVSVYHGDTWFETWIDRDIWQELCRRIAPPQLRDVCDCDETPHERGSAMCVHPPETF